MGSHIAATPSGPPGVVYCARHGDDRVGSVGEKVERWGIRVSDEGLIDVRLGSNACDGLGMAPCTVRSAQC